MINMLLTKDPALRPSFDEIFEHEWMAKETPPIKVFNDAEKIQMTKEFFMEADLRPLPDLNISLESDERDEFYNWTYSNLQTIYENDSDKNISEKSLNLAPFNSSESYADDQMFSWQQDIISQAYELRDKDEVITWNHKAGRANAKYERDHNCHVDNGVYNSDAKAAELAKSMRKSIERKKRFTSQMNVFDENQSAGRPMLLSAQIRQMNTIKELKDYIRMHGHTDPLKDYTLAFALNDVPEEWKNV